MRIFPLRFPIHTQAKIGQDEMKQKVLRPIHDAAFEYWSIKKTRVVN